MFEDVVDAFGKSPSWRTQALFIFFIAIPILDPQSPHFNASNSVKSNHRHDLPSLNTKNIPMTALTGSPSGVKTPISVPSRLRNK
jgi:hypothetical protein